MYGTQRRCLNIIISIINRVTHELCGATHYGESIHRATLKLRIYDDPLEPHNTPYEERVLQKLACSHRLPCHCVYSLVARRWNNYYTAIFQETVTCYMKQPISNWEWLNRRWQSHCMCVSHTGLCISIIVGDCATPCKANPFTAIIVERG